MKTLVLFVDESSKLLSSWAVTTGYVVLAIVVILVVIRFIRGIAKGGD